MQLDEHMKAALEANRAGVELAKVRIRELLEAAQRANDAGLVDLAGEAIHKIRLLVRHLFLHPIEHPLTQISVYMMTDLMADIGHDPKSGLLLAAIFTEGMERGAKEGNPAMHKTCSDLVTRVAHLEKENALLQEKMKTFKKGIN